MELKREGEFVRTKEETITIRPFCILSIISEITSCIHSKCAKTLVSKTSLIFFIETSATEPELPMAALHTKMSMRYYYVQNKKIKEESFRSMELLSLFISSARLPFIFLLSQKEYPSRQHTAQRKQYSH